MALHLVKLEDSSKIQFDRKSLVASCEQYRGINYGIYHSTNFINGTGFVRSVFEEIDLVMQSNVGSTYLNQKEFVESWDFTKYVNYHLSALSGGWRKFLGVALFTNLVSEGKIYFDVSRQLSDRLISLFVKNLRATGLKECFIFDYDTALYACEEFNSIYYTEGGLSNKKQLKHADGGSLTETNYDS